MGQNRLLFVGAAWPPLAAPEADHGMAECLRLAAEGGEVHVLTTDRADIARPPELHVHAVARTWGWRDAIRVNRVIRDVKPRAVLIFFLGYHYNYSTMVIFIPTMVKLRGKGRRVVTQFANLGQGAPDGPGLLLALRRWIFSRLGQLRYGALLIQSDQLLVMSRHHEQRIRNIDSSLLAKTSIVPPPPLQRVVADTDENRRTGRRRLGIADADLLFMYFSRLYPDKGIEMLLRSFRRLLDVRPEARLAMVGGFQTTDVYWQPESYPAQLGALAKDLRLDKSVVWSGEYAWDSNEASEYLRAADVAILPFDRGVFLHNSSFAMVAAHGVPAIVTEPRRGLESDIVHGENVYAIPAKNEDALLEAMAVMSGDAALRDRIRKGSEQLARRWFNWDSCTEAIRDSLRI